MMTIEAISTRRSMLGLTGTGVLSAMAVGLLGSSPVMAAMRGKGRMAKSGDVDILNVALGLEHEAIEAYQIGAESGLLQKPVLDVAVLFQGHHKGHRDAIAKTIRDLGGTAVAPKSRAEYLAALNAASIKNQTDILRLAQRLERGAANAYLGVIPAFANRDLAQVAGKLATDETVHWTTLSQALGDSLSAAPFILG
jgi:Ferritin-like domain